MHDTTDSAQHPVQTVSASQVRWRLHVVASPDRAWRGRLVEVPASGIQIGRVAAEGAPLQIADSTLSRQHFELQPVPDNSGVKLRDLGSHNGTMRGGVRVASAVLGDGAVLSFGESVAVMEGDPGTAHAFATPTADVPGHSVAARHLRCALEAAARDTVPVLLLGATGSGKEFAAQELHRRSGRTGPLVRVQLAGIAPTDLTEAIFGTADHPGLLHAAAGGSLLLDGLDDLDAASQPKLLRALEEPAVPTHLPSGQDPHAVLWIATASDALDLKVRTGEIRRDLVARFRSHTIRVPQLAERTADLLDLADAILPSPGGQPWTFFLLPEAIEALLLRKWPENLRELLAVLRHLRRQYVGARLGVDALPAALLPTQRPQKSSAALTVPRPDVEALHRLLSRYNGNIERLAVHYGRHRKQVYRWMERAGIDEQVLQTYRRGERE